MPDATKCEQTQLSVAMSGSTARDPLNDPFQLFIGRNGLTLAQLVGFAQRPVFRIRGFSGFKAAVEPVAANMAAHIPAMGVLQAGRPTWTRLVSNGWDQPYAPRQISDAMNNGRPRPMILVKALQTLMLCEVAAQAKATATATPPFDVLARLFIEPAVFGIQGFTLKVLETAEGQCADLWPRLFAATQQSTQSPIIDMAKNVKPVSLRLASRVHTVLVAAAVGLPIGGIVPLTGGRSGAATSEDVDGPSDPPF
jgi:hypothetical protein